MAPDQHASFVEHFLRHQDDVYGYVAAMLPYGDDADEVFQRAALVLWEKRDAYDPTRDFRAWACGIARNTARNYVREKRRQGTFFSDALMDQIAETNERETETIDDRLRFLTICLEKLSIAKRALLERCYGTKESMKDIAAEQGLTSAALYKRLDRMRSQLFDCIQRESSKESHV